MISLKNVSYKIKDKFLIKNISVDFQPGKLHLIIGPNGAGKSTLIKLISNQVLSNRGSIFYDNREIGIIPNSEIAKVRAVLSQNIELAFPLKVLEVVMMGRYPHFQGSPSDLDWKACDEAMRYFEIDAFANRNYLTLSGGEKQRVQFARVLSQIWFPIQSKNRYLILDEPLTFLDVYYQFQFMHKIKKLVEKQDIVVVGVIHDLNLAAKYADTVTLLLDGQILVNGLPKEVFSPSYISKAYRLNPTIKNEGSNLNIIFEENFNYHDL